MKKRIILFLLMILSLLTIFCGCQKAEKTEEIRSVEDLARKKVAVLTGSVFDRIAEEKIPGCEIQYCNTTSDCALMLEKGKVSAYLVDEPISRILMNVYPDQKNLMTLQEEGYAFFFRKDSEKGETLCAQINDYLAKITADGTLEEIDAIWFGEDEEKQVVDYDSLSAENGTLKMAVITDVGVPFIYVKGNQYAGYDVDIAAHFCREYGYGLEVVDSNIAGCLANIATGKCDFGASCVAITEERKETMLFSDPDYYGGVVLMVKNATESNQGWQGFLQSSWESFQKTFIREDRWKLFVGGIGTTLLITVLSAIFGTLLGFAVYVLCRNGKPIPNGITNLLIHILGKMPVVVVLMVFYYVFLGSIDINPTFVSTGVFTLLFAASVYTILKTGVGAIEKGQEEAALALGYTDWQSFIKIIFPQAIVHILPGYKNAVISLIKDTAIVGYISAQDLTKVSDIVRSRTMEAFFPIIATAVIYFLLASFLTLIIQKSERLILPKNRDPEKILKGVKTK